MAEELTILVGPTAAEVRALATHIDAEIVSMVRNFDTLDTASIPNPVGTGGTLSVDEPGFVAIARRIG